MKKKQQTNDTIDLPHLGAKILREVLQENPEFKDYEDVLEEKFKRTESGLLYDNYFKLFFKKDQPKANILGHTFFKSLYFHLINVEDNSTQIIGELFDFDKKELENIKPNENLNENEKQPDKCTSIEISEDSNIEEPREIKKLPKKTVVDLAKNDKNFKFIAKELPKFLTSQESFDKLKEILNEEAVQEMDKIRKKEINKTTFNLMIYKSDYYMIELLFKGLKKYQIKIHYLNYIDN